MWGDEFVLDNFRAGAKLIRYVRVGLIKHFFYKTHHMAILLRWEKLRNGEGSGLI